MRYARLLLSEQRDWGKIEDLSSFKNVATVQAEGKYTRDTTLALALNCQLGLLTRCSLPCGSCVRLQFQSCRSVGLILP